MTDTAIARLHRTFAGRKTPEEIAGIILAHLPEDAPRRLRSMLDTRVRLSTRARFGWSSMSTRFRPVDPMDRQLAKAEELARLFLHVQLGGPETADDIEAFAECFSRLIHRNPGQTHFVDERHNRASRARLGLKLSRRRYDKLFRLACRLETRVAKLRREEQKHRLLLVAKAGLAPDLTLSQLEGHFYTAAFVAYLTARTRLRSEFTNGPQQKPFDELAGELLKACQRHPGASWYAIAHVFPRADMLSRLNDEQKGGLLGRWFGILKETAECLREAFERSQIDLDCMIVRRGNDSSTWNLFAGAWNRARDHWIALVSALGMHAIFEALLPGKVLRLMAADVAAWHRLSGGGIHPDTLVWRELPKPWLVLSGEAVCGRALVVEVCARHGVAANKTGWAGARPRISIATYKPTPELVHGVSVENPWLASMMRRLGAYSGRPLREAALHEITGP